MRVVALLVSATLVASSAASSHAAIIVNDSFEYANQAALESVWTTVSSPAPVLWDAAPSSPANKSVHVPATGTTSSQYRSQRIHTSTADFDSGGAGSNLAVGDKIVWKYDFYDSVLGNPQRNYMTLQDGTGPTGTSQLISIGLNNNRLASDDGGNYYLGRILGYTPPGLTSGAYFKLNDNPATLRTIGWHELKVEITTSNGTSQNYRFYVDGILSKTVSGVGTVTRQYNVQRLGSGLSNGSASANFDNAYLEVIPRAYTITDSGNVVVLNNDTVSFGTVTQGDPDPTLFFAITNTASTTLNLTGHTIDAPFDVFYPSSIAPGASGTIQISMGTATAGDFIGALTFNTQWAGAPDANASGTFTLNLDGTVVVAIPEPATFVLLALAFTGVLIGTRRRSG